MSKFKIVFISALVIFIISFLAVFAKGDFSNIFESFSDNYKTYEYEYEETLEFNAEDIKNININVGSAVIEIVETNTEVITVTYKSDDEDYFENNSTEDSISIKSERKIFSWFSFGWDDQVNYILITVPTETNFSNLDLVTSNGLVDLSNITSDNLNVETSNGKINLTNADITNKTTLSTSNGSVTLTDVNSGNADIKSSNGKITLENIEVSDDIKADTSNGKIIFKNIYAKMVNADTSNGDVNFENVYVEKAYLDTSNGDIEFKNADLEYQILLIDADTSNGSKSFNVNVRELRD